MRKFIKRIAIFLTGIVLPAVIFAQTSVSGKVTDASGSPLSGATVSAKSTTVSTSTDANGAFTIKVPGSNAKLIISFVGYITKTISVESGEMTIKLNEDNSKLSEVVVTGLASTIKKTNSANSVATINAKELTGITRPPTLDGAISGKVAGAQISPLRLLQVLVLEPMDGNDFSWEFLQQHGGDLIHPVH